MYWGPDGRTFPKIVLDDIVQNIVEYIGARMDETPQK